MSFLEDMMSLDDAIQQDLQRDLEQETDPSDSLGASPIASLLDDDTVPPVVSTLPDSINDDKNKRSFYGMVSLNDDLQEVVQTSMYSPSQRSFQDMMSSNDRFDDRWQALDPNAKIEALLTPAPLTPPVPKHATSPDSPRFERKSSLDDMMCLDGGANVDIDNKARTPDSSAGLGVSPTTTLNEATVSQQSSEYSLELTRTQVTAKLAQGPTATALGPRTAEEVIADLRRPLRKKKAGAEEVVDSTSTNTQAILDRPVYTPQQADAPNVTPREGAQAKATEDDGQQDGEFEGDEQDEEDDDLPENHAHDSTAQESRRRTLALVNAHVQTRAKQDISDEYISRTNNIDDQSAKRMVIYAENRHIISSPRDYQIELFERAKAKNIIAVLNTGSGKTLIAALLLRHIWAQELEDRTQGKVNRVSFFVVHSVTLLHQQHAVLKANLNQQMSMLCGAMGCDLWNKEVWDETLAKNSLIVCTAEILYKCLMRSYIRLNRINLLIFDEAHHAKKNDPYARIIKDFYLHETDKSALPKIFGMTASPVDARVDVKQAAAELEGLLQCEIATVADTSLLQSSPEKVRPDVLIRYDALGRDFQTPLYNLLSPLLYNNNIFKKVLTFARESPRELGPWFADQIFRIALTEEELLKLAVRTDLKHHANVQEPIHVLEDMKEKLQEARAIVKDYQFEAPNFESQDPATRNLSSKILALIDCLKERFAERTQDKCIVFVKQRFTAQLLLALFSQPNGPTPHLHPGILVGTGSGEAGDMKSSFRQQVVTMMQFRKGAINCLFATSVAEEGLDIPDCNLVIRFDLYTTLIQYIQSRGRARRADSNFIHMFEERNINHARIIKEVRANENILKQFCSELPDDRKLTGNDFDRDYFLAKEKTHRMYEAPETGAKMTYRTSLAILSRFVDSLPHGADVNLNPNYVVTMGSGNQFVCEVVLPEASPVRGCTGNPNTTKQIAKCSAAYETCLLLRKMQYLDEWLLPKFHKQLPVMRNAQLAVDSKKRESYVMRTKPDVWSTKGIPEELFANVLFLTEPDNLNRPSQPLAILTRTPLVDLPSFVLHFGHGRHSSVKCVSLPKAIKVDQTLLNDINVFTLCIMNDVFSKEYEPDVASMPYFLAPIKPQEHIDQHSNSSQVVEWDLVKRVADFETEWLGTFWENRSWETEPEGIYIDRFISDPYDGSRKFWSKGVSRKYKPLDPVPPGTAPRSKRRNMDNIMEYSNSRWTKSRERVVYSETQPVIEAELISLRRNLLDEVDTPEAETPKAAFLIIQPLKLSPLPTTVVAMAYLFPAILHKIESYLIALDACTLLNIHIHPELALEAMTKDSDNTDEHGEERMNFQRGMGKNYERLEFLGDCFLKMATSMSLFGVHPSNDEYHYHVDRMLLICNKNLRNNAVKLKLFEYIRSQSFNRRAWYPEGLVLKKGKATPPPKTHKLGDKTIADVAEALIGAAFLSPYGDNAMDNAVRAVTELVASDNHKVATYADYYKLYEMPQYLHTPLNGLQRDMVRQLEESHRYHFRYPKLARSAFTHPSYPHLYENIPSYQRLEFLGDSLLDMVCVTYLFHNFPNRDPQWLTEHKMAMVSNQFLGALCVSLGFHRHLVIFSQEFSSKITAYVDEVSEARLQAEEEAVLQGKSECDCTPDYWVKLRHPPKCLPDVVEAYIGAIFVDSEYNYAEVQRFFDEHIKWFFNDMTVYDSFANKHPTTFLTSVLVRDMRCSKWAIDALEIPGEDDRKARMMAVVTIHDKIVSDATAESVRYAKVAAAKKAFAKLDGVLLEEFRERWSCDCKRDEVKEGGEEVLVDNREGFHDVEDVGFLDLEGFAEL